MIKLHVERIKTRYFRGYVYREELPEPIQRQFTGETVEVEGEYAVEWNKDTPIPVIYAPLLAFQYKTVKDKREIIFASLTKDIIDFKAIIEEINEADHYQNWLDNRASRLSDEYSSDDT